MDTEKMIFQDMWRFLKKHNDPPAIGTDESLFFWESAVQDVVRLIGEKWRNHPLSMELGIAIYDYLEKKCKAKGSMEG